ncbi:girdin [Notechis scutatus]|uniref:Girdin n=1 Tax=Notechis scutatus TaxID=8663 RepID=A0A6J1UQ89_9SAUR|nr:girdin [Notechis scutatus]
MENEIFTPLLEVFISSPLVTWVKTFGSLAGQNASNLEEYVALLDGVFLNEVMLQINPKVPSQRINKKINNDASLRIQNLSILIRQIKSYYQETLQQLIMMPLPNVLIIGKNPFSEQGTEEVKKLLLLLLGCAVQCQKKEEFIERIQSLDFDVRAAVAAHIQEVTHNQENVFDLQWMDDSAVAQDYIEPLLKNMALHLKRLIDERDEHSETIIELSEERDSLHFLPHASAAQSPCGSPGMKCTESRQHLSVELADAKAKIRRLRQELEEKTEQLLDCKQEFEQNETELKRLQQENMSLLSDARSARVYRDELDVLREKAIRVDKLESELSRYKERLHDIEFYKARIEELKEDNQVLLETKTMLEDQLEGTRARSDKLHELEKENLQLKAKLHDMEMERDMDRKKIEELMEENMSLEMAQKQSMDESLHLGWELEQINRSSEICEVPQKSLGHEVNELTSSRLLKLEMENQTLLKTVEELQNAMGSVEGNNSKLMKMERENQRLSKKLEGLKNEFTEEKQSHQSSQNLCKDLMKEKAQLEKTIETLRENSERQIKILEQEIEHLNQTVTSLRQRSQISAEARVKDIEKENKILHESIKETSSKLSKIEFEKKQMKKELEHYKERGERMDELEKEVHHLEKENELLQKRITNLKITCEKIDSLEQENSSLDVENRKLKKTLDSLKNLSFQLESLEKENAQLDEENLELRRSVESLKSTNIKMAQLELENKELESEKGQLQKSLDLMKASFKKTERLEVSYQGLDTENQRLQKTLENNNKKIQHLESELQELESENQTLQKNLEELKISSKRLEKLEKENKLLEQETTQLEKDKKQLEKENKRLRQQADVMDSTLEENNVKIGHLEKENKSLFKEIGLCKEASIRLKEAEKENKELVKRATIDKKTLVTLRELDVSILLNHTYIQLLKENEVLQVDHKNLKTLLNSSKLEQTRLEAEFSKLKEQYQQLDITQTKLNNQCELLSQLKGNLEEENRHLLDQIQTLMLQNRTLLEQNMESKDLFHVEQRQYIDKLNELRRQKEKLEEKIMDQYKFYEPSPPRRRGNWITLKMRKLIKSKKDVNRERLKSLSLTPTRSESSEGFLQLPHQDSQDSSSVGSNSLEDGQTVGTKKSSMVALKRLPFLRNRPKEKDKMKAFYRRSMSMNDLMQSMVLAGGQWIGSSEHLEGPDDTSTGKRRKELGSMAFSTTSINFATVNSAAGLRSKQLLNNKDTTSFEDVSPQGISDDSSTGSRIQASRPASLDSGRTSTSNSNNNASLHDVKAGAGNNQSRPQSHSSGEFSLLHEHEAWSSSSSSPIQYLKSHTKSSLLLHHTMSEKIDKQGIRRIKTKSPGSEMVTLQQFLEESNQVTSVELKSSSKDNLLDEVMKFFSENAELTGREKLSKQTSGSSGIVRSQSVRNTTELSDGKLGKQEPFARLNLNRTEDSKDLNFLETYAAGSQGKVRSVKENVQLQRQSKDCNPYATLPRASSVISTAEGTTRRTSIHDFLSKDTRQPIFVDPTPATAEQSIISSSSEYNPQQQSSIFYYAPDNAVTFSKNDLANITIPDHLNIPERPSNSRTKTKFITKTFSLSNVNNDKVGISSSGHFSMPFLTLNTELVCDVSGLPQTSITRTAKSFHSLVKLPQKDHKQPYENQKSDNKKIDVTQSSNKLESLVHTGPNDSESPLLADEDTQTIWYEYGCV